jgi:hypothetical protein
MKARYLPQFSGPDWAGQEIDVVYTAPSIGIHDTLDILFKWRYRAVGFDHADLVTHRDQKPKVFGPRAFRYPWQTARTKFADDQRVPAGQGLSKPEEGIILGAFYIDFDQIDPSIRR